MPFIEAAGIKLHYRVIGSGNKVMLAFHGYGQNSSYFNVMAAPLGQEFTIYSFDLFYHGKSELAKIHAPLKKQVFTEVIASFLQQNQIEKFSLMGFSMGGKFVLTLLEAIPKQIQTVYLIAPDGISTSFWYNIATYPGVFQEVFRHSVVKPGKFFRLLDFMHRRRLVDQGLVKFAGWQMDSLPKRLRVYRSWMGFRNLTFNIRKIAQIINRHHIKLSLFIGEHDRVINGNKLRNFAKTIHTAEVVELKSGHTFLLQEVAKHLQKVRQ